MAEEHAFVWTALSAPTRRRILDGLRRGPMTTGQVVASLPFSRIATMKHLAMLSEAALIVSRRRGRERWHYLNYVRLQQILERWRAPQDVQWASRLINLQRAVGDVEVSESPGEHPPRGCPLVIDLQQDVALQAPAATVFRALTEQVASWWGPPYVNAEATDLKLETKLGGAFYEVWTEDAGAILAMVTAIIPDKHLELTGRFHMGAAQSVATFRLGEQAGGTLLQFSYQAIGHVPEEEVAIYGGGWIDLVTVRLKTFVETGQHTGFRASR
jgi:uncharacterized protein YndB with AHSA1/START domain/DNA-binding transcriptional ArsR family regulator